MAGNGEIVDMKEELLNHFIVAVGLHISTVLLILLVFGVYSAFGAALTSPIGMYFDLKSKINKIEKEGD